MSQLKIAYPPDLPVAQLRNQILEAVANHQVVIVAGATGSGKTTQLPKMCLELGRKSIAHTQPRRIAARSVAERIAEELGVKLGEEVGYQVRFTDQAGDKTLVKVMTDGILLNLLKNDSELDRFDTIIIDEAHERSLNIDFLLGYLKQTLPKRPDLKVIITSATIDPESFSRHFGDAPIIEVSGRGFPIEIRYRPVQSASDEDFDASATAADYVDGIVGALRELESESDGDVLVFLSGESEIKDAQDSIVGAAGSILMKQIEVLPLYGRLSASEQHRIFQDSKIPGIRRRIILATNVAETSLTIPNIKYVIDSGTARISRYSPRAKVQRLPIEAISQASANQRAGRAGRTSPGIVIRLYDEEDFRSRPEFTDPEILRTNLAAVILQAASLGISHLEQFPFLQPPDAKGVRDGKKLLVELGALNDTAGDLTLTPLGKQLAQLPLDPRFARMLIESRRLATTREVLAIVAGLSIQDPRERPAADFEKANAAHARFTDPTSDFLGLLNLWNYIENKQQELSSSAFRRLCRAEYLNYIRIREWQDLYRQLAALAKPLGLKVGQRRKNPDGIHKSILAGLISQIGMRDSKKVFVRAGRPPRRSNEYLGVGKRFLVFPGSALAKNLPEFLMSAELVETSKLYARMNAIIEPEWIEELAPDLCVREQTEPRWVRSQGAVLAQEQVTVFGLKIISGRQVQYSRFDPDYARELFIRHALVAGEWDSKQAFQRANLKLVSELEERADRFRKPELAPNDQVLFNFYHHRIPLDVFSTRSFEGWWREARQERPDFLTMTEQALLDPELQLPEESDFPGSLGVAGVDFEIEYRFAPGDEQDGMTVVVPLHLLPGLSAEPFDWLVPGLRDELVTELIRSLPKPIRKNFVPATDWSKKLVHKLDSEGVPIQDALAASLSHSGLAQVKPQDFDFSKLPSSLRPGYRVVERNGKEFAFGKDLAALQRAHKSKAAAKLVERAKLDWQDLEREVSRLSELDVPEEVASIVEGVRSVAFPALTFSGGKFLVKVQASRAEQRQIHNQALVELIVREIPSPADYIAKHLKPQEKLALAAVGYQDVYALVAEVIRVLVLMRICGTDSPLVLRAAEAEDVVKQVQAEILERSFKAIESVERISAAAALAQEALTKLSASSAVRQLESAHIEQLLAPQLVLRAGFEYLPRIEHYLGAITQRVKKLFENPIRDQKLADELSQAQKSFVAAGGSFPLDARADDSLKLAYWMIEEFRVNLFAQNLGTKFPISLKRIEEQLRSVRSMHNE